MSGKMRKRQSTQPQHMLKTNKLFKAFAAPQKDTSKRYRKRTGINTNQQEDQK